MKHLRIKLMSSCPALGFVALLVTITFLAPTTIGCEAANDRRRVISWVPPYAVQKCKERLAESYDGVGVGDGITHLALQFWNPTREGGLEYVSRFKRIDDETVAGFRAWGKRNNVRVLLCVYNGTPDGWDWDLATHAFDKHRDRFIDAIVTETLRLKLDGVDVDLEGVGELDASKDAYLAFLKKLSKRLREHKKELFVDTFPAKWNAPNRAWWPAILPLVDGLNVMGYDNTGANAKDWKSYASLKAAAGDHAPKLMLGMASKTDHWEGASAAEHLKWIVNDPHVGLAIWDLQLKDPWWRKRETWQTISQIKNGRSRLAPDSRDRTGE